MSKVRAALLALCVVSACSSSSGGPSGPDGGAGSSAGEGATSGPVGTAGAAGAGAGEGGAGGGSSVGIGAYRVAIEASRTHVCAGECVELSASAANGRAPHRYAWSGGIGDGAGPHRACPEETTTYSVTARDTAALGEEFGEPSQEASASLQVTVDDGESCELEPDAGVMQPRGTTELCRATAELGEGAFFYELNGWRSNSTLATDAEGNAYIVGNFEGTIDLGEQTIMAPAGTNACVVLKYDATCGLVWAKVFEGCGSGTLTNVIAVGHDGELAIGGIISGIADFGAGPVGGATSTDALIVKLATVDGSVLWSASFGGLFSADSVTDLAIDDAGNITLSGNAGADASFGGAPIGGSGNTSSYVAQLTSDGDHRYSFAVTDDSASEPIAGHGSGDVAFAGRSASDGFSIGARSFTLDDPMAANFVAMLDGAGEPRWLYMHDPGLEMDGGEWTGSSAIDRERNTVLEWLVVRLDTDGNARLLHRLVKLGSDGSLLWNRPLENGRLSDAFRPGGLAVDSQLAIVHVYTDPPLAAGDGGLPSGVVRAEKLTADGTAVWEHAVGQGTWDGLSGLAVGPDDAVWVAHAEARGYQTAFVLTKLAP